MIKKMYTKSHDIKLLKQVDNEGSIFTAKEHSFVIENEYKGEDHSYESWLGSYLSGQHNKLIALSFLIDYIKLNNLKNIISFGAGPCVFEHLLGLACPPPDYRIVATDFDAYYIEKAKKYFYNIESFQFDFFNDNLKEFSEIDMKLNIGISFESFYVMNNEQYISLLKQCKECKIKTIIYFSASTIDMKSAFSFLLIPDKLKRNLFLRRLLGKESLDYRGKLHGYARDQRELKKLYLAAGYELERKFSLPKSYKNVFIFKLN